MSRLRKFVDTFAPSAGTLYRKLRDAMEGQKALPTRFGFTLAGCPPMTKPAWEAEIIHHFLQFIETHDAFIDIGANVGIYSCLAASRGKRAISFEPCPRNLPFLYRNLLDNDFKSVEVFPIGLGKQSDLGRIFGFSDMASFVAGWAQANSKRFSVVPLNTLDAVIGGRFPDGKLLIKMDVEGFELDVLYGAEKTLGRSVKPTWILEILLSAEGVPGGINPRFADAFAMFWRHGYRCHALDSAMHPVAEADVLRWVSRGAVEPDIHDFVFSA